MNSHPLSHAQRQLLLDYAEKAKQFAYAPYSKFRVGAALLAADGTIYSGSNVENASYGGTICAERTALVKAVSSGSRSFIGLAVTSDVAAVISPCGICRQFIREFCAQQMPILMAPGDYRDRPDSVQDTTIALLLPHSFGPEDLERPRQPVEQ